MLLLSALLAATLGAIHLLSPRMRFLDVVPRSRWLSLAGGIAVSYVFLHILPELSSHQRVFAAELGLSGRAAETWVYLLALLGLAGFYGLERLAKRRAPAPAGGMLRKGASVFWLHIGSFAIYNVLIGYLLLHREEAGIAPLLMYFTAMALHFLTNDFGLRQDHRARYDHKGRWVLSAAPLLGWVLGISLTVPPVAVGFLFAFLAGGVVLNVLKEELPEERQSRFPPFALGVAAYAALLIAAS